MTGYLVPARTAEVETEVRRSRFLCRVERVGTDEEARAAVEAARSRHPDAGHHCSASVLGPQAQARAADDGEPSGTAGAPMLDVLRGVPVSDVVVVVTRWFGGTLLGAGGLVRAYADAARAGLAEAGLVERRLRDLWSVEVGLSSAPRLDNDLRSRGVVVRDASYGGASVTFTLAAAPGEDLPGLLASLTAGAARAQQIGTDWVDG